jgi:hypothetical protein
MFLRLPRRQLIVRGKEQVIKTLNRDDVVNCMFLGLLVATGSMWLEAEQGSAPDASPNAP